MMMYVSVGEPFWKYVFDTSPTSIALNKFKETSPVIQEIQLGEDANPRTLAIQRSRQVSTTHLSSKSFMSEKPGQT